MNDGRQTLKLPRAKPGQNGCLFLDKRAGREPIWRVRYRQDGKHKSLRIGTYSQMPDRDYAAKMAGPMLAGILDKEFARKVKLDFSGPKVHREHGCPKHVIQQKIEAQNNRCMICGREAKLHLDHCHYTNTVRDMLCSTCNMGLGQFQDNPMLLRAAALYLEKHGR